MDRCLKLGFLAVALAMVLGTTPSEALPSACSLRCFSPSRCGDACVDDSGNWTTCFDYLCGSCVPACN
jgi:hypothetical protein